MPCRSHSYRSLSRKRVLRIIQDSHFFPALLSLKSEETTLASRPLNDLSVTSSRGLLHCMESNLEFLVSRADRTRYIKCSDVQKCTCWQNVKNVKKINKMDKVVKTGGLLLYPYFWESRSEQHIFHHIYDYVFIFC